MSRGNAKLGRILWWDQRDLNGVIVDTSGNEFYFDISVIENRRINGLKAGAVVQFQINSSITNIACAKSVLVPPAKIKDRLEKEFQKNLQLAFAI
jgi:cold shock CspA family protein